MNSDEAGAYPCQSSMSEIGAGKDVDQIGCFAISMSLPFENFAVSQQKAAASLWAQR